jgi:restriction system protein
MNESRIWVVRIPKGPDVTEKVRSENLVAIGFSIQQDIRTIDNRDKIKELYLAENPDASNRRVSSSAGQLFRFANSLRVGDWVLSPDRDKRTALFGKIMSEYDFLPDILKPGISHYRKVEWHGEFSRDDMSISLKNSTGSLSTVFNMDKHSSELFKLMNQPAVEHVPFVGDEEDEEVTPLYDDTKAKADDLIADIISKIDPYDFQDLVAGLLKTMGYRTRVSDPGPDHGIDIFAHPDAFGFVKPRIKVQVKRKQAATSGQDIRALMGTLGDGENGLFVSSGGFTTEARNEARRNARITLIDMDEFVKLLTENYEKLDSDCRAMIPLRKVWMPTS